jgi:hypothetical protein
MGRLDEARAIVAKLRVITPQVMPSAAQFRNPRVFAVGYAHGYRPGNVSVTPRAAETRQQWKWIGSNGNSPLPCRCSIPSGNGR